MTSQPARIVVAGVEVDAYYADGRDPLIPAGTLTMVRVTLGRRQANGNITGGLVGMAQVDPETGQVVAWEIGTPRCGWIPDVNWPTIEEAVRVIRNPALADKVEQLHTLRRDAYDAESKARTLHQQADDLLAEITAADTSGPARSTRRTRARLATVAA